MVFVDMNRNGEPDDREQPLPNVLITCKRFDGTGTTRVTFTGQDGQYLIEDLEPGVYWVEETDPHGYYSISANRMLASVQANSRAALNFADYPQLRILVPLILQAGL